MFNFNYDGMQGRPYRLKYTYMSKGGWFQTNDICLTSLTRAKCGVRSTLCWKIPNISGSIQLFAL